MKVSIETFVKALTVICGESVTEEGVSRTVEMVEMIQSETKPLQTRPRGRQSES